MEGVSKDGEKEREKRRFAIEKDATDLYFSSNMLLDDRIRRCRNK